MRGEPQPKIYAASGIANREGNAELSSDPGSGRKGRFRFCDDPLASSMPPPRPSAEVDWQCLGALAQDAHGVYGDTRDTSIHPPPKLRQRTGESGAKLPEGWGRYSHGLAGLEQVRDRGHRWRQGSSMAAALRPPSLGKPGAPAAKRRVD